MVIYWIFESCTVCKIFPHRTKNLFRRPYPKSFPPGKGLTDGLTASKIGSFAFAKRLSIETMDIQQRVLLRILTGFPIKQPDVGRTVRDANI